MNLTPRSDALRSSPDAVGRLSMAPAVAKGFAADRVIRAAELPHAVVAMRIDQRVSSSRVAVKIAGVGVPGRASMGC